MSNASPPFDVAGRRHLDDGRHLVDDGRHVNGDHLIGLAAECLLKAVLVGYLGATVANNKPPATNGKEHKHLPTLWTSVGAVVSGRSGSQFSALLGGANPFSAWSIHDRYADGSDITVQHARDHLTAADTIAALHQQAVLNGVLP
jgi:hypothetical protein